MSLGEILGFFVGPLRDGSGIQIDGYLYGVIFLMVIYALVRTVYNVLLHPLSSFPGPRLAAASNVYKSYMDLSGGFFTHIHDLHKTYGPIVRFGPNHLSFSTPTAFKTIYGHTGSAKFLKSKAYGIDTTVERDLSTQLDPAKHSTRRKLLAPAFSAKALQAQEHMIVGWIDLLVSQLATHGLGGSRPLDAVSWYNWATFDIISDLAFGRSFGCLERAAPHYWVENIYNTVKFAMLLIDLQSYPWVSGFVHEVLFKRLLMKKLAKVREEHHRYARELVKQRMQVMPGDLGDRKDFMFYAMNNKDPEGNAMTENEILAEMSMLVIAGSETTATFLAGCTYYLTQPKNRGVYDTLVSSIREKFRHSSEITFESTSSMPYLNAVIEESLRMFPPVPTPLRRVSPGAIIDGAYIPPGTEIGCSPRAMTRNPEYFHRPDEFLPERWLANSTVTGTDEEKNRLANDTDGVGHDGDVKDAHEPFSIGTRACIGRNLAYVEMRVILAKILWRFDMECEPGYEDWMAKIKMFFLWEKTPFLVRFKERKGEREKTAGAPEQVY